jgi:hypothetical protein
MRRSSVRIRFPAPFFLPFRHFPSGAQKVYLLFSDCVEVAIYVCCEVRTRCARALSIPATPWGGRKGTEPCEG